MLAASNLVFTAGLALLACAAGPTSLALAWAVIGLGMGFGLYEAAFATVTGLYGREARNAITGITLVAGFASTVGWPASAVLIDALGWRDACLAWAGLHLAVALPLNRFLVPKAPPPPPAAAPAHAVPGEMSWSMVILAAVFAATAFVSTTMATHLPRIIEGLGTAPAAAIVAASLVGPAQVAARVAEFALFGPAGYGLRMGLLAAPARLLQSGARLLFALVLDMLGPHAALLLSGALTALSLLALFALTMRTPASGRQLPRGNVPLGSALASRTTRSSRSAFGQPSPFSNALTGVISSAQAFSLN